MHIQSVFLLGTACLAARNAYALQVDISSTDSIESATKSIASRIIDIYNNGSTVPGLLASPYYFWEGGLAWDSMINYWSLTGDETYNSLVGESILFQTGPNNDFMPPNQTKSEGNDDQSFWALAAMTAAERGFPVPTAGNGKNVSWVQLAQNVFDSQVARWDDATCGGGLRWQIFPFNAGYNYKNSLSNGNFVQLSARLASFTGNTTYSDWAEKAMQWSFDVGLISNSSSSFGAVWDGASTTLNCSQFNHLEWTASLGTYLSGAAYGENFSQTLFWSGFPFVFVERVNYTFAANNTPLAEIACEPNNICNTDQLAFKAVLARSLADARDLTWDTEITHTNKTCQLHWPNCTGTPIGTFHGLINEILQTSAQGAATQCSGGESGTECGSDWSSSTWDGTSGLGQELSALEILLANLPAKALLDNNSTGIASGMYGSNATSTTNNPGAASASAVAYTGESGTTTSSMFALICGLGFAVLLFM